MASTCTNQQLGNWCRSTNASGSAFLHFFRLAGPMLLALLVYVSHPANASEPAVPLPADPPLADRIEDLKAEVIELNRDLYILEEELLFPASSQVAVFLSADVGEFFQLDSVKLKLDGDVVTHYLYTDKEIEALRRGGVQRLFVGNLRTGEHTLTAIYIGKGPHDRTYRRAASTSFSKQTGPKQLELKIVDDEAKLQPRFLVKEWN